MTNRILILDDEVRMASLLERSLSREGYEVVSVNVPEQAIDKLKEESFDVLLTDLRMPGLTGIDILKRCRNISPETDVILMTAYASVETTREALKEGAVDYLIKPISAENDLKPLLKRLLEDQQPNSNDRITKATAVKTADQGVGSPNTDSVVMSDSPAMKKMFQKLEKIARSDASVLLRGESGTGKEVTSDLIQSMSPRSGRPYLKVNCGALSETLLESELFGHVKGAYTGAISDREGLFASASSGTLMLDEVGEVSPSLQVKLLRVLQSGEYTRVGDSATRQCDVRIIAATNRNLEKMIETGEFRQDLYYRLNVVPVELPPLRDRREDLPKFIAHFVQKFCPTGMKPQDVKFSPEAMKTLESYTWPGNVRELENAIEHALVLGDAELLQPDDLPIALQRMVCNEESNISSKTQSEDSLEEMEKTCLLNALKKTGGNQTRAAKLLGVTRRTLGYRIKKYELEFQLSEISGRPNHSTQEDARE